MAAKKRVVLPAEVAIDVEVDLGLAHGVHGLAARLSVNLPGLEHDAAQALVDGAHQACPYSLATHGNIEVTTSVITSRPVVQPEAVHQ